MWTIRTSALRVKRAAIVTSVVLAALTTAFAAEPVEADPPVKKSTSGICHAKGTAYYAQTRTFEPFSSMQACLDSGGRYPKGQEPEAGPPVKKSRSGICHDRSSPSYGRTQTYTPFDTLEECVRSGGRLPKSNSP
jgi:hypothetical protein